MQFHATATSCSEFLTAVADQKRAQGLDIDAEAFEQRAAQAKQLETDHAFLLREHEGTKAELDDLRSRVQALAA